MKENKKREAEKRVSIQKSVKSMKSIFNQKIEQERLANIEDLKKEDFNVHVDTNNRLSLLEKRNSTCQELRGNSWEADAILENDDNFFVIMYPNEEFFLTFCPIH